MGWEGSEYKGYLGLFPTQSLRNKENALEKFFILFHKKFPPHFGMTDDQTIT